MTIKEIIDKYRSGKVKPTEYLKEVVNKTESADEDIKAYIDKFQSASKEAELADYYYLEDKKDKPLAGVPLAIKNNILVKGERATASSKILENYKSVYDATIIRRLREAGAVLYGSTNMDEFAMGSSTENSALQITKNPIDKERVPGGSSGGSAAAVSMGSVPAAIGTDTGGSIRQPASYCGLVGFKPTYGAVSRYGLIAMGSSLDQAGPLTNSVADAELIHQVISGKDENDGTTIEEDTYKKPDVKESYKIGVPRDFLKEGLDEDVKAEFERHLEELKELGHEVVDVSVPMLEQGLAAYYIVMPAEVSSNLARFDGMRYGKRAEGKDLLEEYLNSRAEGFGPEVKRRILLGTYVLSSGYYDAYYGKAEAVRKLMREELGEVFKDVDFLVTPTTPTPAFKLGEKKDPMAMYQQDIFTVPVNLTGVPAISIPAMSVERDGKHLPVGVQYIAPHAGDFALFDLGKKIYDDRV